MQRRFWVGPTTLPVASTWHMDQWPSMLRSPPLPSPPRLSALGSLPFVCFPCHWRRRRPQPSPPPRLPMALLCQLPYSLFTSSFGGSRSDRPSWIRGGASLVRLPKCSPHARKAIARKNLVRILAMSNETPYKMNLNEYMVTLDRPLGIRFALSTDGRIFVHSLIKGVLFRSLSWTCSSACWVIGNRVLPCLSVVGRKLKLFEGDDILQNLRLFF